MSHDERIACRVVINIEQSVACTYQQPGDYVGDGMSRLTSTLNGLAWSIVSQGSIMSHANATGALYIPWMSTTYL